MSRVELFETIRRDNRDLGLWHPCPGRQAPRAPACRAPGAGLGGAADAQDGRSVGHRCSARRRRSSTRSWPRTRRHRRSSATPPGGSGSGSSTSTAPTLAELDGARAMSASAAGSCANDHTRSCDPTAARRRATKPRSTSASCTSGSAGVLTKCCDVRDAPVRTRARRVHRVYATQAQEAFFDGHVEAFAELGGVPRRIRYDNLKPAVDPGAAGPQPGGERAVHRAALALRFRQLLLHPGRSRAPTRRAASRARSADFAGTHLVPVPVMRDLAGLNAAVPGR